MNNVDKDFLKQIYSYAVVIRTTPEEIQHLKELLAKEGYQVVYQKTSLVELRIVEGLNHEHP
jgi:hypothetical protein